MSSPSLAEIDEGIRATKARLDQCNHLSKPSVHAPFDGDAMAGATLAERRLRDLHQQRTKLLAGETEPPPPAPAPAALTMPPRMTPKDAKDIPENVTLHAVESYFEDVAKELAGVRPNVARAYSDATHFAIVGALSQMMDEATAVRRALEARIAALEARPSVSHKGIWKQGTAYGEGSLTTHSGSLWIARTDTTQRPGSGASDGWDLVVKKGGAV